MQKAQFNPGVVHEALFGAMGGLDTDVMDVRDPDPHWNDCCGESIGFIPKYWGAAKYADLQADRFFRLAEAIYTGGLDLSQVKRIDWRRQRIVWKE